MSTPRALARPRATQTIEVTNLDGDTITVDDGWSWSLHEQLRGRVHVGSIAVVETIQFSRVVGWFDVTTDAWLWRLSDEDLDAEDAQFRADMDTRHGDALEANRADWTAREEALPAWLQARLATFHERGGRTFELEGWGYELAICEVAALWDTACDAGYQLPADQFDFTVPDPLEVATYARENGTSGNQHGFATALVRAHREGQSVAGTVSALSPITGDAFYEGRS